MNITLYIREVLCVVIFALVAFWGNWHLYVTISNYYPKIYKNAELSLTKSILDMDFVRLDANSFKKIESISIDHGILEKTSNSYVIPTNLNWNDLGTYNALWDIGKK